MALVSNAQIVEIQLGVANCDQSLGQDWRAGCARAKVQVIVWKGDPICDAGSVSRKISIVLVSSLFSLGASNFRRRGDKAPEHGHTFAAQRGRKFLAVLG